MRYSVKLRDPILVIGYEFLSFAKNMGQNNGKNISKNLNGKYSQKLLDHTKQSAKYAFKTASKRAVQKSAEATGQLQMSMIKRHLWKDIYLQKKDRKLLMI